MSKKNLLNEGQVRQFMKLARLEPLTPGFVHGLTEKQGAVDKEDEHLGAKDGKEADKKQSMKDRRKEMRGEDRAEGDDPAAVEERRQTRPPGGGPGGGGTSHGRSSEPMPGDKALMREEGEEDELESELGATEDELGAEDELADAEGEELGDLEGAPLAADEGRMVSVDDFLEALESALEAAMGDEVEVDASEMEDEAEVPEEEDFAPEGEDVVADVEMEEEPLQEVDDEELEEGVFGGGDKYEKIAKGKKGSYAPDPEEGEEEWKGSAPGPGGKRRRDRRRASDIGGGGGMTIKGLTSEGQTADDLVEQVTKRVAARILKTALAKK